eukprot:7063412-Pyramimonas_sp.AAC.1
MRIFCLGDATLGLVRVGSSLRRPPGLDVKHMRDRSRSQSTSMVAEIPFECLSRPLYASVWVFMVAEMALNTSQKPKLVKREIQPSWASEKNGLSLEKGSMVGGVPIN